VTRDQLIETMARASVASRNLPEGCDIDWDAFIGDAIAALTAIEAVGMRVVPAVPINKIIIAGIEAWIPGGHLSPIYEAMIDAAQEDSTSE
jgi:hypothetical protein